jgi:hypothetical protein
VASSARRVKTVPTAASFQTAIGFAGGLRIVGFLFRAENLTFRVFGVDYVTFLANAYPFLERLRAADGDSLRRLFDFLTAFRIYTHGNRGTWGLV